MLISYFSRNASPLEILTVAKVTVVVCRENYDCIEKITAADWLNMLSSILARIFFGQKLAVTLDARRAVVATVIADDTEFSCYIFIGSV